MNTPLAPIVLFVYNRPEHTLRTLSALAQNFSAPESDLFIYADGAKRDHNQEKIAQVHEIIDRPWGFKSVTIVRRTKNWGLAANIIDGVTTVINRSGKAIILEDDLETSPYALQYFNDALNRYQHQEKVMSISGYNYPLKNAEALPETFFFRVTNSWGWATWDRAWKHFNPNIEELITGLDAASIHRFSIDGKENFWKQVQQFRSGKINSWAIRWYLSVFRQQGLTLYPRHSYVQNIGTDGTGTHSDAENTYRVSLCQQTTHSFPEETKESAEAYAAIKDFYAHRKGNLWQRGIRYIRKIINNS